MISLGSMLIVLISGYAVLRNTVAKSVESDKMQDNKIEELEKFMNATTPALDHYQRIEIAHGKKIDKLSDDLIEVKTKLNQTPSMREVRNEFVSKEVYLQMEKHIDEKFAGLQSGIADILKELKEGK